MTAESEEAAAEVQSRVRRFAVLRAAQRALIEVAGQPMLLRVLRTLRATPRVGKLVVSIDDPAAAEAQPEIADLVAAGELILHRSLASPSRSVLDVMDQLVDDGPLLVTTADHALLSQPILDDFLDRAEGVSPEALDQALAAGPRKELMEAGAVASCASFAPRSREGSAAANAPMDLGSDPGGPGRSLQLFFLEGSPDAVWERFRAYGAAVGATGLARVALAAPFLPTSPGTDR